MALELSSGAAQHRRLHCAATAVAVGDKDRLVVRATAILIAAITAVRHIVALPPEGDALLTAALEHPLVAVSTREVGCRRGG